MASLTLFNILESIKSITSAQGTVKSNEKSISLWRTI